MHMKKKQDRHENQHNIRQRRTRISSLKRVGILGLSLLLAATSETSVTDALMARAEEEKDQQCVITAFMPLPEDIATQTVCVGTLLEDLQFPNTLEAVGRYESEADDSDDMADEEQPEEENQTKEPGQNDSADEEDEDKDRPDEIPEESDTTSDEPSGEDGAGTGQEGGGGTDSGSEGEESKEDDPTVEESKDDNSLPEDQKEEEKPEDQMEEDKTDGASAGNGETTEEPETENSKEEISDDAAATGGEGTVCTDSTGTATVYVDILNNMISTVKDKVVALFDNVTIEEKQIMLASNMAEAEQESDVQTLTQTVSVYPVTWNCISDYDSETEGCYVFMPKLPEGCVLADDVTVPEIVVIISGQEVKSSIQKQKNVKALAQEDAPASGSCGSGVTWSYDSSTGTLTIAGSGAMNDFNNLDAPWRAYQGEIRSVVIESGVTSIGSYAFFKCASLSTVTILSDLTSIGEASFFECTSLGSIEMPNSVTSIGSSAFFNCSSLGRISIPTDSAINSMAFYGCNGLERIEIPAGAATVAATAFEGCTNAFLYYPKSKSALGATDGTRANIAYTVAGGNTSLEIARVAADLSNINFPVTIGGGTVWEANWNEYLAVKITHEGLNHRYADGSSECAVCGYQKAPGIKIDYINEILIGFEAGKAYSYSVTGSGNGTLAADAERKLPIKEAWFGKKISIAVQGTGNAQELQIPSRPAAPSDVNAQGESAARDDGRLLGVTSAMEYSTNETTDYKPIAGETVDGLSPGTYYVRYQAVAETSDTKGKFHSLPVEVVVDAYKLKAEETPKAEINYETEKLINLAGGAEYKISTARETTGTKRTANSDGSITLEETLWFGKTIYIIKTGDGTNTEDSAAQSLSVPLRPAAPANIGKTDASAGREDGTLTKVTSAMVYRLAGTDTWLAITGTTVNNLKPGKYEIRYKARPAEKKFASEIATQIIASADRIKEDTPKAVIDFEKETLTGLKADEIYQINGTETVAETGGIISLEEEWIGSTLRIVKAGDQMYTDDSDALELVLPPRPAAPEKVAAMPVSAIGAKDGKLIYVDNTMQYRRETDDEAEEKWTSVTSSAAEVTGLEPGTYFIRIKATADSFRSEEVERIVQDAELKAEMQPAASIDYETEKLTGLTKNAKYSISDQYGNSLTDDDIKADKDGKIAIDESWMGTDIDIVKTGNQFSTKDSDPQQLSIPERPAAPDGIIVSNESGKGAKDGILTDVDHTMQYRKEGANEWKTVGQGQTTVSGLAPGVYYVRYRADQSKEEFASSDAEYTIKAYELQPEPEPAADISFAEECFISLEAGAVYKINGTKIKADENGEIKIKSAWMAGKTVTIIKAGDGVTTSDSLKQGLYVPKKRPAPSGIKAVSESEKDQKDGKLTGVNDEMEYRQAGGEWFSIYEDILEPLEPGKYEIRYTYTDDNFASAAVQKTIYAYGEEPKAPIQNKDDASKPEDSDQEQSETAGGQNDSSQNGGAAAGGAAGSSTAGNKAADAKKNGQAAVITPPVAQTAEPQANEGFRTNQIKENSDSRFVGTAIADSEEDEDGGDGKAGSGRQTGNGEVSAHGKDEGTGEAQDKDAAEVEKANRGQYSVDGAVYTERAAGRMSEFYGFVLDLANSRNLGWIAIILAEPIIFLLILIYALGRKSREKEC